MAKSAYIPTTQEIDALYQRAIDGDPEVELQIGQLNQTLAKRANTRMRDIESKGLQGTAAYNRAKYWLGEEYGGEYFKQNKVPSKYYGIDDMIENIEKSSEFLRSQTSTSAGEIKRRKNVIDSLAANEKYDFFGSIAGEDIAQQEEVKQKLLELFDTEAWEDIRKSQRGGTNPLVQEAVEAINNGALLGDLKRAFKDFQKKTSEDQDYIELWDEWSSAQKYYQKGAWHELKHSRR